MWIAFDTCFFQAFSITQVFCSIKVWIHIFKLLIFNTMKRCLILQVFSVSFSGQGKFKFAVEVLRVIGLSPCQPDHAFESSTTIKVITMQIPWLSLLLWKVHDPVTKELHNHFHVEFLLYTICSRLCGSLKGGALISINIHLREASSTPCSVI